MKLFLPTTLLFLGISLSAQMPGMMTVQSGSQGTALGANETLAYNGIALGNRVKMRGYVDFIFSSTMTQKVAPKPKTSAPIPMLIFFFICHQSPVRFTWLQAELALIWRKAFGRYSFNNSFHLTFGRQLTSLGFEADEAPGLYAVSNAYYTASHSGTTCPS